MRKYIRKLTVGNKKVVDEILCNICGHVVSSRKSGATKSLDYVSIRKRWGYSSNKDGQIHRIDICETCYDKLVNNLIIPPSVTDINL